MQDRSNSQEWLDGEKAKGTRLDRVLLELDWINIFFGNRRTILKGVERLINDSDWPKTKTLRILDLGVGSGQNLLNLCHSLSAKGFSVNALGLDKNPDSLQKAAAALKAFNFIPLEIDVETSGSLIPEVDIVISSHFIYHLNPDQLQVWLERNGVNISLGLVLSELRASSLAKGLFAVFGKFVQFDDATLEDGIIALGLAYTKADYNTIEYKGSQVSVEREFPFRYLSTLRT